MLIVTIQSLLIKTIITSQIIIQLGPVLRIKVINPKEKMMSKLRVKTEHY